jgi:hypothetical protein
LRGFEPPRYGTLLVHAVLCALIYPTLLVCTILARNKSIFWARFIVGVGCTLIGVAVARSLLRMARRIMEAAGTSCPVHSFAHPSEGLWVVLF